MTAVEWLQDQYDNSPESILIEDDFKQAKEMEKEQMIDFADEYSQAVMGGCLLTPTEFYNETFKSE